MQEESRGKNEASGFTRGQEDSTSSHVLLWLLNDKDRIGSATTADSDLI